MERPLQDEGLRALSSQAGGGSKGTRRAAQRAFLIHAGTEASQGLDELQELMKTAGAATVGTATQTRSEPHPDSYMGSGKALEILEQIKATDANLVVADDELSPRQERNLEEILKMPVVDRTAVILDIFALHAGSAEGKLQVELAQLEYNLARMRGLWTHLERLGGGIGTRGPGESQLETDRRLARDRISTVRKRLNKVQSNRKLMRSERERTEVPQIALVGYTNAGKSTLMNCVTGSEVGIRDELFHTLDPTTRQFEHRGRAYVMTDTVGFIRKLPHQLVDAFGATLEETIHADVLVLVEDGSQPPQERQERREAVEETLSQIGASELPRLTVVNKRDLMSPDEIEEMQIQRPEVLMLSAETGEGVEQLLEAASASIGSRMEEVHLLIPYSEGRLLDEIYRVAGDLSRQSGETGVEVTAKMRPDQAARYSRFAINSTPL
ncbi:MAG: GTPase HflX [Solirubrobacterales bacterium]|nr:GTPase HflX [Solirubrobacterales bacterium]